MSYITNLGTYISKYTHNNSKCYAFLILMMTTTRRRRNTRDRITFWFHDDDDDDDGEVSAPGARLRLKLNYSPRTKPTEVSEKSESLDASWLVIREALYGTMGHPVLVGLLLGAFLDLPQTPTCFYRFRGWLRASLMAMKRECKGQAKRGHDTSFYYSKYK